MISPNTLVGQMRLLTGDYTNDAGDVWLPDSVYTFLYAQNNNSILDGAIAALESIINNIALRPTSVTNADSSESYNDSVRVLSIRLDELKLKRKNTIVPVVIKSDRKNWNDFNELFGKC